MSQISSTGSSTLTAIFDSRHDAEDAVRRLVDAGLPQSSVRLLPGYEADETVADRGEVHKGFFASLADFFMPDEDRYSYAEGLSRGGYLVSVSDIDPSLYDKALDILDDEGAVNLDEREESWRGEGWGGYAGSGLSGSGASSYGTTGTLASAGTASSGLSSSTDTSYSSTSGIAQGTSAGLAGSSADYGTTSTSSSYGSTGTSATGTTGYSASATDLDRDEDVIPVVEEELRIGKRDVNLGRVRVRSYVRETPVSEQVNLRNERVEIERRAVDRPLADADLTAFQDRTIEAEEHAEEAVVSKTARVTEEIALRKEAENRTETVSDSVRKTEVEIEDDRDALNSTSTSSSTYNSNR